MPLYSRIYRIDLKYACTSLRCDLRTLTLAPDRRWTFLSCIFIFEIGSLICAVAQDSTTFSKLNVLFGRTTLTSDVVVGRAIAGFGVAGGYVGVMTIVAASVPLDKKAAYAGVVGGVCESRILFSLAWLTALCRWYWRCHWSSHWRVGPIFLFVQRVAYPVQRFHFSRFLEMVSLSAAFQTFTDALPRCFWINLPIGGISMSITVLVISSLAHISTSSARNDLLLFQTACTTSSGKDWQAHVSFQA